MTHCPHCGKSLEEKRPAATIDGRVQVQLAERQADWFCEFWHLYPRKVGKASALKAWKKAAKSEAIKDEIMEGLCNSIIWWDRSLRKREDKISFIPHAATWINGRRWEDETTAPAPSRAITPAEARTRLDGLTPSERVILASQFPDLV